MAITDYVLLGVPETADLPTIRSAYHRRAKETHPDAAPKGQRFKQHLLFIEVTKAYQRLVKKHRGIPAARQERTAAGQPIGREGIVKHKDPAYVYYKQGMKAFVAIHPSAWSDKPHRRGAADLVRVDASDWGSHPGKASGPPGNLERVREKVEELSKLFPKAYYFFGVVATEYPDSVWAHDSRAKLTLIQERSERYKRILESLSDG